MNPNVNMANMNPMGGPVGGAPVPMMNNGAQAQAAINRQDSQRGVLNTYIYEYFIRYGMYECARSLLSSDQPVNVNKDGKAGNAVNGVGDDAMDTDTKDNIDTKLPDDLPPPKLPMPASDTSFLYEWFCLFWDIYNAQRVKGGNGNVNQYVAHTQQQSRMKQNQQQELLRQMRPEMQQQYQQMIRMQQNGAMNMQMKQPNLSRVAMANNQTNPQMMMQQAKQNQMQRDPSSMDGNRERPSSPANGENAPSPSKRQRVDNPPFNPQQPGGMMPNGRPGQNMPPQQVPGGPNAAAAQQMLTAHGINPQLGQPQFNNFMPNAGGPQGQNSPMMPQGHDGNAINYTYNPSGEMGAPGGLRPGAPGAAQAAGGSNHALQDYQMQLMLLEQQNKKRLMMARQEQDNIGGMPREGQPPGPGGPGVPTGPNGQGFPEASPQAMRTGASPNPAEQMKRGTPQMNNSGIPSPVPEGGPQSRDSPNPAMNFMGNADPNVAPHFFNKGADGNMVQANMNGMRPPSSHPGQPFNPQMNQQMMAARQQAAAAQQGGQNPQQWQQGPNGQMVPPGMQQGQQVQGTPQQRPMPPPSAPAGAVSNTNNRTTASPQQAAAAPPTPNQTSKPAPKSKKKGESAKDKRAANQKKANQNANNAGATPANDNANEGEGAAPATPITPVNPAFKNGQTNGAPSNNAPNVSAPPQTAVPAPQPPTAVPPPQGHDPNQNGSLGMDNFNMGFDHMDMGNPLQTGDMLNDFDFDSFLNDNDTENQPFDFNGAFSVEGEIGTE